MARRRWEATGTIPARRPTCDTAAFLLYLLGLGVGFLLVEISFVQKYVLLVFAALGTWLSRRFGPTIASPRGSIGVLYVVEALEIIELLLLGFQLFLYFAIAVTLLVGAAGVMNVMFVIVTERTREIGLRKAVGGSNGAIFVQFLMEAVVMTLLSGALGATLGVVLVWISQVTIGEGTTFASAPVLAARPRIARAVDAPPATTRAPTRRRGPPRRR